MAITPLVWTLTLLGILGLLAFDVVFHVRRAHVPSVIEAARWTGGYVACAVAFGLALLLFGGPHLGSEFFAGYITEMSLSVDNLFVFLVIMNSFRVPRAQQPKVLVFGIVVSLVVRSAFIFVGVVLVDAFTAVFYVFGVVLLLTAGNLLRPEQDTDDEDATADNLVIRTARRFLRTSEQYDGDRLTTTVAGRRVLTPMLLVMVSIGGTDVMFALDSIPAIFGLTQNGYVIFTAVAFSLMGLRQLFFLIDGLLDRLVYLRWALAIILALIGVKLILHALHENTLPFVNGGRSVPVVQLSTGFSLAVIIASLAVTTAASLASSKGRALTAIRNARRHARQYLDLRYEAAPDAHERLYRRLVVDERQLLAIPARFRGIVHDEQELFDLIDAAHRLHERLAAGDRSHPPERPPEQSPGE